MKYMVQFTRYFEEFGWEDVDTKEFDNIKDAYDFYSEKKEKDNQPDLVKLFSKEENRMELLYS